MKATKETIEGILPIYKPSGMTSFRVVSQVRRCVRNLCGERVKVGHGGTLDPFATGVLVVFIGRSYTKQAQQFLLGDKEYKTTLRLGIQTTTLDRDGDVVSINYAHPSPSQVDDVIAECNGWMDQVPPMFSAKRVGGKRLYHLARQGKCVDRASHRVHVDLTCVQYQYPFLEFFVRCSKGTYIRSLAETIGKWLGCGAMVDVLCRTKSGPFTSCECLDLEQMDTSSSWLQHIRSELP